MGQAVSGMVIMLRRGLRKDKKTWPWQVLHRWLEPTSASLILWSFLKDGQTDLGRE